LPSIEGKLFFYGGAAVSASGLMWFIPGLNAVFSIAAIAALILIVTRLGYARATIISLAGLVLVMLITSLDLGALFGALNGAIFAITVIAPGIAMGMASRGFSSPIRTVWYGFIPILILFGLLLIFYTDILNSLPAMLKEVNSYMTTKLENNPAISKMFSDQNNPDIDTPQKFIDKLDKTIIFFVKIMPGTIIVGYLIMIVLSLVFAGTIASRIGVMLPRLQPFYLWRASDWWLLPTAIGLALVIFSGNDFWRYFGGNILVITGNIYAIAGLAVMEAIFRRMSLPVPIRIVFYIITLLLFMIGLVFLAILGLADSRFNFRRDNLDRDEKNME
jgi:uncharacterized protein YybS (DUF2232 family)